MNRTPRALAGAAAVATALGLLAPPAAAQHRGPCPGRPAEEWSVRIAPEDEPGQPLVVSGRVVDEEGRSLAGVEVFVFHTDARGYYSPDGMDESNARLCGRMLTDAEGRYRFETVRPAHYATGGPPAHVHYLVEGPGVPRQRFVLHFEGDPKLGERGRDASGNPLWASIRPAVPGEDGVQRVTRDLRARTR
ncbi:MAG: protocatechuate 3,4-dioxygenase [Thermoanaerobaculia bacterium]|nr:protocatechuate 3,4-dioxygenase [Thermoanaerobaculia bacterium]